MTSSPSSAGEARSPLPPQGLLPGTLRTPLGFAALPRAEIEYEFELVRQRLAGSAAGRGRERLERPAAAPSDRSGHGNHGRTEVSGWRRWA